jgi:hypothetical protein
MPLKLIDLKRYEMSIKSYTQRDIDTVLSFSIANLICEFQMITKQIINI